MDFKPMKKDGKPDASGHFARERPALRARIEEERKAGAPKKTSGPTPDPTGLNNRMMQRDDPKNAVGVVEEPRAESVCEHLKQLFGYGPWIAWDARANQTPPKGIVSFYRVCDHAQKLPVSYGCQNRPAATVFWDYRIDKENKPYPGVVVAYCLTEVS